MMCGIGIEEHRHAVPRFECAHINYGYSAFVVFSGAERTQLVSHQQVHEFAAVLNGCYTLRLNAPELDERWRMTLP